MRKIILLILLVSLLCSCVPATDESKIEDTVESYIENPYQDLPLDSLEVYITYSGAPGYMTQDIEYCVDELRSICMEEMNTEVNIHALPPYDTKMIKGYQTQMKSIMDSGQPVDIYIAMEGLNAQNTGRTLKELIDVGLAADITNLIPAYYPEALEKIEKYSDNVTVNGIVYGIPITKRELTAYGMWIPRQLSDRIEDISNFDDVINMFDIAMADEYTVAIDPTRLSGLWAADHGFYLLDTYLIDEINNQVIPIENTDLPYDIHDVCSKLYAYPNLIKMESGSQDYVEADCQIVYYTELGTYNYSFSSQYINDSKKSVLRLVNIDDAFYEIEEYQGALVVHSGSQRKDRAIMFLDFVHGNEKASKILIYGIEGQTYTTDEEGRIVTNKVGLWGDYIANMEYDDKPYYFEVDDSLYREVLSDNRIGRYRSIDFNAFIELFDTFTQEQMLTFASRSFINNKDNWEKLYTEYDAKDIVAELKEINNGKPEDVLTDYFSREGKKE